MPSQTSTGDERDAAASLPLFYREPQLLSSQQHADWRLGKGDAAFAAGASHVPIVIGELAAAARCYPVVFAAGDAAPVAILGLEQVNLFVKDGRWSADAYVPAYVRRHPFGFVSTTNPDGFALIVDAASERLVQAGDEGEALFEEGLPSALTRQALAFCEAFQAEAAATQAFASALRASELLVDRRADATLADGRKLGLEGFQIVDAERFAGLGDDVVLDWHRRGWLSLVDFHLASLQRFEALLALQNGGGGAAPR